MLGISTNSSFEAINVDENASAPGKRNRNTHKPAENDKPVEKTERRRTTMKLVTRPSRLAAPKEERKKKLRSVCLIFLGIIYTYSNIKAPPVKVGLLFKVELLRAC